MTQGVTETIQYLALRAARSTDGQAALGKELDDSTCGTSYPVFIPQSGDEPANSAIRI